jgi:Ca-activated chloride channel homolog
VAGALLRSDNSLKICLHVVARALHNRPSEHVAVKKSLIVAVIIVSGLIAGVRAAEKSRPDTSINVGLDVVLVPVTVTDDQLRPVEGLNAGNFQIWEDKVEQHIEYFSAEDTPVSIGLLLDISGSMRSAFNAARSAAINFLKTSNAEDEYFLVEFSDSPRITQNFTTDVNKLERIVAHLGAQGYTAFLDAVYLALDNVRFGVQPRKALVMITDGEDNHSRYTLNNVKDVLKESDAQLYAVDIGYRAAKGHSFGRIILDELTEFTGGRVLSLKSMDDLDDVCAQISRELKSQYLLGYVSTNKNADGKWRKLKVKVNPPAGAPRMNVRAKPGYYAAQVRLP